jgi:hypothetical protein
MEALHRLIDTHLSSPSLPPHILAQTKTFLFLLPPLPSPSSSSSSSCSSISIHPSSDGPSGGRGGKKERIVGACVVQQIREAMRVLEGGEVREREGNKGRGIVTVEAATTAAPVAVEEGVSSTADAAPAGGSSGVFCECVLLPLSVLSGFF